MIAIGPSLTESDVACGRGRDAGAAIPRLPANRKAAAAVEKGNQERSRPDRRIRSGREIGGWRKNYFATKPASFISEAFSLSSSSRNLSMSLPVRKIGFSACFSM